ncbi:hypothetical protein BGW39_000882 [Mortierella sp. 14UC]|nr:hypothetical protein BGW39_000882 [Mortierella sp. 14UC]
MGVSRTWVLKGSLWIQAVFLLVLTSILADTNAWIGAIFTGTGLFFVVIGIIAAQKRRISYLYLYATLVGLWQILALTHILVICGLIALPTNKIDLTFIVGQKIVGDPSYPPKVAIPVLYGFQWCSWCVTLVCMVSPRLETVDPTQGFEIQNPKQQRHSLKITTRNSRNNTSISPQFWRQQQRKWEHGGASSSASSNSRSTGSAVSSGVGVGMEGHSSMRTNKGKEPIDKGRYTNDGEMPQVPERSRVGMERKASSDINAIFIPSDPRISRVVVTFKDNTQDSHQQEHYSQSSASATYSKQIPETTTIYITNHHYGKNSSSKPAVNDGQPGSSHTAATAAAGLGARKSESYILNFSASGESLSDMILKSTQHPVVLPLAPLPTAKPSMSTTRSSGPLPSPSLLPQPSTAATKEMSGFRPRSSDDTTPNPARICGIATKVSLTLSSDSSSSELSALSNASSDSEELLELAPLNTAHVIPESEQAEESRSQPPPSPQHGPDGVVAGPAMTSVHLLNHLQEPEHPCLGYKVLW